MGCLLMSYFPQQECVQLSADVRSLELDCGSLVPDKSFFQERYLRCDSARDEDFIVERGKVEVCVDTHVRPITEQVSTIVDGPCGPPRPSFSTQR